MNSAVPGIRNGAPSIVILALLCLAVVPTEGFAQTLIKWKNTEYGYAFAYPESWLLSGGERRVDVLLPKTGGEDGANAGFTIKVDDAGTAAAGSEAYIVERSAGQFDGIVGIHELADSRIGNRYWRAFYYRASGGKRQGTMFVLIRGASVFTIDTFWTEAETTESFHNPAESILRSFSFIATGYVVFRDDCRGITFRHPNAHEAEDSGDSILIMLEGEDAAGNPLSLIRISVVKGDNDQAKVPDDGAMADYMRRVSDGSLLGPPERVTLARMSWLRGIVATSSGRMTFYLSMSGNNVLMIVHFIRNGKNEEADRGTVEIFFNSLTLDAEKWIKCLQERHR